MSTALYRKWRSQTFDEVIGQDHVTRTVRNAVQTNRVAHAYLFTGPRGTGKTSMARILAKALNCSAPLEERPCNRCDHCVAIQEGRYLDLIEIDAASNNSVDNVRELREKVAFQPAADAVKVYIIDEVHMLSGPAFNALLKTLEEPPSAVYFILATTEVHKVPATILSRCQRFDFRRIPAAAIAGHLRRIALDEGRRAEEDALDAIARSAQGCMRDAVSLLDQMLSYGNDEVTFAQVQEALGAVSTQAVVSFVDALARHEVPAGLSSIQTLLASGGNLQEFCQQVVEHLRALLLAQMAQDLSLLADQPAETVAAVTRQAQSMTPAQTLFAIRRFTAAAQEMRGGFQPQLPMELALIESVQGPPVLAASPAAASNVAAGTSTVQAPFAGRHAAGASAAQPGSAPGLPTPAAPAGTAAVPTPAPTPVDAAATERFRTRQKAFKDAVKAQCGKEVLAAVNSARDIAIGGNQVVYAFGNNEFARNLLSKPENQARVAAILAEFLGAPVTLECQLGDHAQLAAAVPSTRMTRAPSGPDPLVEFAVTELNAEVRPADKTQSGPA